MASHESIDVDECRDGLSTRKVPNRDVVVRVTGSVDSVKVQFCNYMHGVIDRWVLGNATLKMAASRRFPDQLNTQPTVTEWVWFILSLRCSASADLRDDAIEIDETEGNSDEAANLPDSVSITMDKSKPRDRVSSKFYRNRCALHILDSAYARRIMRHRRLANLGLAETVAMTKSFQAR
ncbi:MAG: hypothetical protein AMXMBFR82_06740 [Candidatus Hydrogenedentota bacterium]